MLREGVRTKAMIIRNRYKPGTDGEGDGVYYPTVQFVTQKNEKVVKELDFGYSVKKEIGTELNVVYDPENPSDFVTSPTLWLKIVPRLLIGGGLGGITVGVMDLLQVISVIPD
jgi:hypothetical protein